MHYTRQKPTYEEIRNIPVLALLLGVIFGFAVNFHVPPAYTVYLAMIILSALDSVIGAIHSGLDGKFKLSIFMTGFTGNAAMAVVLVFIGNILGLDFSVAPIIVFGVRIFNNVAEIRRILIKKHLEKK